jgi:hypothetical protein
MTELEKELLDALKQAERIIGGLHAVTDGYPLVMSAIQSAIAKAEGK